MFSLPLLFFLPLLVFFFFFLICLCHPEATTQEGGKKKEEKLVFLAGCELFPPHYFPKNKSEHEASIINTLLCLCVLAR